MVVCIGVDEIMTTRTFDTIEYDIRALERAMSILQGQLSSLKAERREYQKGGYNMPIDELWLDNKLYNCIRAGYRKRHNTKNDYIVTIGDIVEELEITDVLLAYRGLGENSYRTLVDKITEYQKSRVLEGMA